MASNECYTAGYVRLSRVRQRFATFNEETNG
jgi:hypothetical protein